MFSKLSFVTLSKAKDLRLLLQLPLLFLLSFPQGNPLLAGTTTEPGAPFIPQLYRGMSGNHKRRAHHIRALQISKLRPGLRAKHEPWLLLPFLLSFPSEESASVLLSPTPYTLSPIP